jgi:hypothetical protein
MKFMFLVGLALSLTSDPLLADPWMGQAPESPYLAYLQALPDCGFGAIEYWGQNGFQPCDLRNIRPRANRFERKRDDHESND